jgi:hypothetical protein
MEAMAGMEAMAAMVATEDITAVGITPAGAAMAAMEDTTVGIPFMAIQDLAADTIPDIIPDFIYRLAGRTLESAFTVGIPDTTVGILDITEDTTRDITADITVGILDIMADIARSRG